MARRLYNNSVGQLGASLSADAGPDTITFLTAPSWTTLASGDYIPLVLEPPGSSPSTNFEIVHVTAYTAGQTTATISRGQEGTTSVAHANGVVWVCAPVVQDVMAGPAVLGASGTNLGATQTIDFGSLPQTIWLVGTMDQNLTVTIANRVAGSRFGIFPVMGSTPNRTLTVTDGVTPQTITVNGATGALTEVLGYCPDPSTSNISTSASGAAVLTAGQVALTDLADFARDPWLPSGFFAQTMDRRLPVSNLSLSTGVMFLCAIPIPAGKTVSNISVYSTNAGATSPTAQWAALYDPNRNLLETGVDQTTTAWAAQTERTFALASPYSVTTDGLYYAAVMVAATTAPNLAAYSANSNPGGLTPTVCFTCSTSGLTTPSTAPSVAGIASGKAPFWAALS